VLGRTAARSGRLREARDLLDAAKAGYLRAGERGEALSTDARIAETLVLAGQNAAAKTLAADLAAQAVGRGMPAEVAALDRLRGYLLAQQGHAGPAAEAFEASLASARERSALYDQALSLDGLIRLARHTGQLADPAQAAERAALFGRLGVIATAAFPLSAPQADQAR
jgi:hypothetical protein